MMKTPKQYLTKLGILLVLIISLYSCNNDDDNRPPIDQLPEATQTGRGIFGALVDGEAFVETNNFFNTFYQQVDGEFFFGLTAQFDGQNPSAINLATKARTISEGETFLLIEREDGNAWGGVTPSFNETMLVKTNSSNSGILTITKLDFENNIVSGTFEMTVVNPYTNQIVEITEGRFDTLFTQ
jgi:hypothetical protein